MRMAVIPARGGSKRIPRKNIKEFCGKPMIAWSIETAIGSGVFDRVIVSTDDDEIARVAKEFGAEVPFLRPRELATDFVGTTEVIGHAAKWAIDRSCKLSAVCCIYATAPFIQVEDIRRAWTEFSTGKWEYIFAATDFPAPIFRSFSQAPQGGIEMFFPEHFDTRSQDLPTALHDAGQFYWGRPNAWIEGKRVFASHSKALMIPRWRVQDIDSYDDWLRAEMMGTSLLRQPSR